MITKMLKTAEPTMVPVPTSLFAINTPENIIQRLENYILILKFFMSILKVPVARSFKVNSGRSAVSLHQGLI